MRNSIVVRVQFCALLYGIYIFVMSMLQFSIVLISPGEILFLCVLHCHVMCVFQRFQVCLMLVV